MTITRTFAGVTQPDVASIQIGGDVFYRCYTYLVEETVGTGVVRGTSLRARCFVEQGHAQAVELFDNEVANNGGAASDFIDCPKIIAVGTTFVVCWLENTGDAAMTLHMATLDMSTVQGLGPAWDDHGSISTHDSGLYDLVTIDTGDYFEHHATDYIVVHRILDEEFAVRRHNGFDWVSTDWITNYNPPGVVLLADRILAAHAYEELLEINVLVTYQTDPGGDDAQFGTVRTARFSATTGAATADTASFALTQVSCGYAGHARVANGSVALVIEYLALNQATDYFYIRWLGYVLLDSLTTVRGNEHTVANLTMLSRPFALPSQRDASDLDPRLYCAVGYKNTVEPGIDTDMGPVPADTNGGGEWAQTAAFIVDLCWNDWTNTANTVRPFPVSQVNQTIVDARVGAYIGPTVGTTAVWPSGTQGDGRRQNNISHVSDPPDFGPSVKSVTVAIGGFSRVLNVGISTSSTIAEGSKLRPAGAKVIGWEFNYEDPWTVWRDGRLQPLPNWRGVHALASQQPVTVAATLTLSGGTPSMYSGTQLVEMGFPVYPEIVELAIANDAGANMPVGLVYYTTLYEWTDDFGVIHRSAPAVPRAVQIPDATTAITLVIRTLTISLKDNTSLYPEARAMQVVVYRTAANQNQFFRLHSLDSRTSSVYAIENTPANDPYDWNITVVDVLPEATLLAASDVLPWPILDTSGTAQPLQPEAVPASCVMAVYQERLWMASIEDPNALFYSLALEKSYAPEFNVVNVVRRDNLGPITGMAAMDTQLVVFTPDRIYSVVGRVNNGVGLDGDLSIHLLAEGVGCVCARSVVVTAGDGVFFQSRKGYYQLDRGGGTKYVGADVEDYIRDAGTILNATLLEDRHQIRLVCNGAVTAGPICTPVVLIYDYLMGMWSRALPTDFDSDATTTNQRLTEGVAGVAWPGHDGEVSHVLVQQGAVGIERSDIDEPYADRNDSIDVAINMDVQTGWIHLAGIVGYQRIREIQIMLRAIDNTDVTIDLEYDRGGYGVADATQSVTFATGASGPLPLRVRPSVQKCSAFRVRIRESSNSVGNNITITGITMVAGIKRGLAKVPAAQIG